MLNAYLVDAKLSENKAVEKVVKPFLEAESGNKGDILFYVKLATVDEVKTNDVKTGYTVIPVEPGATTYTVVWQMPQVIFKFNKLRLKQQRKLNRFQ